MIEQKKIKRINDCYYKKLNSRRHDLCLKRKEADLPTNLSHQTKSQKKAPELLN